MEKILVTGCAGFIGMHLCKSLLKDGSDVFGIDNVNDYYDPLLKKERLKQLDVYNNFKFSKIDISKRQDVDSAFNDFKPDKVVNLAAQAGVRYSLKNPHAYIESNVNGFMNILEGCRHHNVEGLIYASSSSVYGGNKDIPFSEDHSTDNPISIYASTKKANELMAHTYSYLYGLRTTGLRFFTVYGPWGRPDMAMYIFAKKISNNLKISVFNHGKMIRDFTYIDDIINGIKSALKKNYSFEIFNLGNNRCEDLMKMINIIEDNLGINAKMDLVDIQPGDVKTTFADISHSQEKLGYNPETPITKGIPKFLEWYRAYHNQS